MTLLPTYTVQPGDTLPELGRRFLGDSGRWREIQLYNQALLVDPAKLAPGMVLRLPPGASAAPKSTGTSAPSKVQDKLRAVARR